MSSLTKKEDDFLKALKRWEAPERDAPVSFLKGVQRAVFQRDNDALEAVFQKHPSALTLEFNDHEYDILEDEIIRVFFDTKHPNICKTVLDYFKQNDDRFYHLAVSIMGKIDLLDLPPTNRVFALDLLFKHAPSEFFQKVAESTFFFKTEDDILFALQHPRFPDILQASFKKKYSNVSGKVEEFFSKGVDLMSDKIIAQIVPRISPENPISLLGAVSKCKHPEQVRFFFSLLKKYPNLRDKDDWQGKQLIEICVKRPTVFEEIFREKRLRTIVLDHLDGDDLIDLFKHLSPKQSIALFKAKQNDWERVTTYGRWEGTLLSFLAGQQNMTLLKVAVRHDPTVISRSALRGSTFLWIDMLTPENKTALTKYALAASVKTLKHTKQQSRQKKM